MHIILKASLCLLEIGSVALGGAQAHPPRARRGAPQHTTHQLTTPRAPHTERGELRAHTSPDHTGYTQIETSARDL